MKNLKKFLPLLALVLGLGLVMTQSAFTKKTEMYGKTYDEEENVHWVSLEGLTPYNGPGSLPQGTYRCNFSEDETCTAEFSTPPSDNDVPTGIEIDGIFEVNP